MEFSKEVKEYIDKSILCWLATSSSSLQPNVSPKEIFDYYGDSSIVIANIASPQTLKNIKENSLVCVSFIEVLIQKGFQIKGEARILKEGDEEFQEKAASLLAMTGGKYPFREIFLIEAKSIKPILAPSYFFYPDTSEEDKIANAKKAYGLQNA